MIGLYSGIRHCEAATGKLVCVAFSVIWTNKLFEHSIGHDANAVAIGEERDADQLIRASKRTKCRKFKDFENAKEHSNSEFQTLWRWCSDSIGAHNAYIRTEFVGQEFDHPVTIADVANGSAYRSLQEFPDWLFSPKPA